MRVAAAAGGSSAPVSDTESELWWSNQEIYDIQSRELVDDWRVLWLMDSPSTLNRQPIIDLATP